MFSWKDLCQWSLPWYLSFNYYLANIFHDFFLDQCTSSSGSSKCLCGINTCQPGETCANGECLANPVCQFGIVDVLCQCGQGKCAVGKICANGECLGICLLIWQISFMKLDFFREMYIQFSQFQLSLWRMLGTSCLSVWHCWCSLQMWTREMCSWKDMCQWRVPWYLSFNLLFGKYFSWHFF